jgi:hypothetical protein
MNALPEIRQSGDQFFIRATPPTSPEQMVENMRSALSRGLPEVRACQPHGCSLAVAAGGPSLSDTYESLKDQDHIAAVNGSLGFLLDKGIVPTFCGVLDSSPHMADVVVADSRVRYLIASNCHPSLFEKLIAAGCKVWLWHTTPASIGTDAGLALLKATRPDTWLMVGGGCTIGLRWVNLGYVLGYREFHLHGLDSSFRDRQTHAYDDRRNGDWVDGHSLEINGYKTSLNFMQQVTDAAHMIERFKLADMQPVKMTVYGDGLLQAAWRFWEANQDSMSAPDAFQQW